MVVGIPAAPSFGAFIGFFREKCLSGVGLATEAANDPSSVAECSLQKYLTTASPSRKHIHCPETKSPRTKQINDLLGGSLLAVINAAKPNISLMLFLILGNLQL